MRGNFITQELNKKAIENKFLLKIQDELFFRADYDHFPGLNFTTLLALIFIFSPV